MTPTMIPDTAYNRLLANDVHAKMRADSRYIQAQAGLRWLAGGGAVLLGVAACIWAYGTYTDPRTSAEKMAAAMAEALNRSTLKTTGEVALKADPLQLDTAGAKVGIDTTGVRLALEPGRVTLDTTGAKVGISGEGGGFRPSTAQFGEGSQPVSRAQVTRSFTVFNNVSYRSGLVVTGWNYEPGTNTPKEQYCYFTQPTGDGTTDVKVNLANDRRLITTPNRIGLNSREAAENCVWYNG
jgi:hypothetical protein